MQSQLKFPGSSHSHLLASIVFKSHGEQFHLMGLASFIGMIYLCTGYEKGFLEGKEDFQEVPQNK